LDDLKPSKLLDVYCDAKVQEVREYERGDSIKTDARGGGGTSFVPAIEYCEGLDEQPKALVYLTDLDGTFPDHAPAFPVIWISYGTKKQAPFGQTVNVE
jgi:predicted metal-dependent peptidase